MPSAGAVGHEGLGSVEVAWLRADGAIDLAIDTRSSPYAGHAAALLHDADVYAGRAHRVLLPDGCRYTAAAAGVRHVCGAGIAATYCLRSDGRIDRITTPAAAPRAKCSRSSAARRSALPSPRRTAPRTRSSRRATTLPTSSAPTARRSTCSARRRAKGVGPMNEEVRLDGRSSRRSPRRRARPTSASCTRRSRRRARARGGATCSRPLVFAVAGAGVPRARRRQDRRGGRRKGRRRHRRAARRRRLRRRLHRRHRRDGAPMSGELCSSRCSGATAASTC